ncbi:MAG: hypothetical protein JRI66_10980 [Deltaproteobacteria bacterium]|nr:hypothetical protein [Deltaproteobacteria bacterium]
MDAAAKRYTGAGHRLRHHDLETAAMLERYYRRVAPHLVQQAYQEVILHVVYDRGLITGSDVTLMRLYTGAAFGKKSVK